MSRRQKAACVSRSLPTAPAWLSSSSRATRFSNQGQRGLADRIARSPITPETAFDLASVSKHFTAVAILQLVERDRLTLDAVVADFLLPWAAYPSGRPLRLLDLLEHTSGLPDYSVVWRGPDIETRLTNGRFLRKVLARPPLFPAGTKCEYSNTNYILLAAVIEAITGLRFREVIRRNLFEPLGMTASAVVDNPAHPIANRACGYRREGASVQVSDYPISLVGHSHVFTTTADLTRWYRALWSGKVINAASLERALVTGTLDDGTSHIYGLGWFDDTLEGRRSMGHSGSWYGFSAYARRYTPEDLTLVVQSNDEAFAPLTFTNRLAEVLS